MSHLQTEFQRLYVPTTAETGPADHPAPLIDPQGRVRALVLELGGPADWSALAQVWRGVQTDLELPAPAIAASGTEGLQLWFSLAEPLQVAQAHAFLQTLRHRYLPDVPARRVRLMPRIDTAVPADQHARPVPALNTGTGNWSAFIAPDLAPLFAETPWLDIPPGNDGQAQLLAGLKSIQPPMLAAALQQLQPAAQQPPPSPSPLKTTLDAGCTTDPQHFLLAVMNDAAVPLALRIEAAKALLPCTP